MLKTTAEMLGEERGELLIVDDDETSRDMLSRRLKRRGFAITLAENGPRALALIEERHFDLILLDLVMAGMNGLELLEVIREKHALTELPIIMVTAQDRSDDVVESLSLGANDYITKPIDLPVVLARIHTQLLLKRAVQELEALNQKLERLATIDALTGIANRRLFEETLQVEWKRGIRNARYLSVLMLDVDHFKKYNDTYGHEVGDAVLKQVASTLSATVRPGDFVGRYGGEEFVVVLPGTDTNEAQRVAERLRAAVEATEITHGDSDEPHHVTISVGVATTVPAPQAMPEALVAAADGALYQAKRAGRNRVQLAEPS